MKKIRLLFWAIIMGLISVAIIQNWDFLLIPQKAGINLGWKRYTVEASNAIYLLIFFMAGFLVAYAFSLSNRFKSKKTILGLQTALEQERNQAPDNDPGAIKNEENPSIAGSGSLPSDQAATSSSVLE